MIFTVLVQHEYGPEALLVDAPNSKILKKFLDDDRPERKENTHFRPCGSCTPEFKHDYLLEPASIDLVLNDDCGVVSSSLPFKAAGPANEEWKPLPIQL